MKSQMDRDERSGLILREDTRMLAEKEIEDLALGREFAKIYDIDSFASRQTH